MSALQDASRKLSHNELLDCLNDRRRRQILQVLGNTSESVTERELAEKLVVDSGKESIEDVAEATIEGVRIRLQHVHLPRLDDAGLVNWNEDEETVESTDHPIYDDPEFQQLLEIGCDDWDEAVGSLVDGRRHRILSVLESREDSVRRDVLAHEIAAREANAEAWTDAVDSIRSELHHVHLPKLESAGLVEYDVDDGTVTYPDHPGDDEWQR